MTDQDHHAPAILRRKQVEARTGLSRSTLYKLIGEGKFAAPIRLGVRARGWLERDVNAWIESRVAATRRSMK